MVVRILNNPQNKILFMSKRSYDIQTWFVQFTNQNKTKKLLRTETERS